MYACTPVHILLQTRPSVNHMKCTALDERQVENNIAPSLAEWYICHKTLIKSCLQVVVLIIILTQ